MQSAEGTTSGKSNRPDAQSSLSLCRREGRERGFKERESFPCREGGRCDPKSLDEAQEACGCGAQIELRLRGRIRQGLEIHTAIRVSGSEDRDGMRGTSSAAIRLSMRDRLAVLFQIADTHRPRLQGENPEAEKHER